uniref:ZZ-type domain-containing protein n=1 Tax=Eptatretus burgeri TaxID=7764 RepID=A0A8C4R3D9_EPTBU
MAEDFVVTAVCGRRFETLRVGCTESWAQFAERVQKVLAVQGTLRYTDDEGDEVFVDTAEEYEEALKVASCNGNSLTFFLYPHSGVMEELEADVVEPLENHLSSTGTETEDYFKQNLLEELSVRVLHELGKSSLGLSSLNSNSINPRDTRNKTAGTFKESLLPPRAPYLQKAPPVIWGLPCHHCDALIEGYLYSCSICPDLWMCASCETNSKHNPEHPLLKFCQPSHGQVCSPTSQFIRYNRRLHSDTRREMQEQWRSEKRTRKAERKRQQAETREAKRRVRQQRRLLARSLNGSLNLTKELEQDLDPSPTFSAAPGVLPELDAEFVGENVPDGTWIQPGCHFLKLWRLRNCGAQTWTEDTKLQLLWGNLPADSSVPVPCLSRGELGAVSVTFLAPRRAGAYASHWRLAHAGKPFGPRVWCSICVQHAEDEEKQCLPDQKICSTVESVVVQENADAGGAVADEGMSSTEFVCETVIRSLTLDEVQEPWHCCRNVSGFTTLHDQAEDLSLISMETTDSSTQPSDTEDILITLPVCFDTSQPFMRAETASNSSKPGANLWLEEMVSDKAAILSPAAAGIDLFNQKEMQDSMCLPHLGMKRNEGAMVEIDTANQVESDAQALERTVNEEESSGLLEDCELRGQEHRGLELIDDVLDETTHRKPFNLKDAASWDVKTTVSNTNYTNTVNNQPSPLQLKTSFNSRHLVNDALTCASAALRSIFKPQVQPQIETGQALLLEMGFGDRALNSQLLRRHGGDIHATVADLLHLTDAHWYQRR